MDDSFQSTAPQDVSKFLIKFMDYIIRYHPWCETLIQEMFATVRLKHRVCESCSYETFDNDSPHFILNVNIGNGGKIEKLIEETIIQDYVEKDCAKCKNALQQHAVRNDFRKFPKILILLLARYDKNSVTTNNYRKKRDPVHISQELILQNNMRWVIKWSFLFLMKELYFHYVLSGNFESAFTNS